MTKIPFKWLPASWGLKGQSFDLAEANYYYTGKELDLKLLDVEVKYGLSKKEKDKKCIEIEYKYGNIEDYQYDLKLAEIEYDNKIPPSVRLELELKHKIIDQYEYDTGKVRIDYPDAESLENKLAMLEVDFAHGKIEKNRFEKTTATLKEEPWIDIVDHGFDPQQGVNGVYFEFDWNEYWIEFLRKSGYVGFTDEQIVEQWFSDVCRSQAEGTHIENDPVPFNSSRAITRQFSNDDGSTGYS